MLGKKYKKIMRNQKILQNKLNLKYLFIYLQTHGKFTFGIDMLGAKSFPLQFKD